jgi:hypothetical protein
MGKSAQRAKPVSEATRAMLDDLEEQDAAQGAATEDKLDQIRDKVRELREKELEKAQVSETLKTLNIEINDILWSKLPQIMDESGVPTIGIAAEGNKPAYEVVIGDHYKANIPDEKTQDAFALLQKMNSGDLIKTTFTIQFGLRDNKATTAFEKLLIKNDVQYSKKQSVPWNTLTAWFKTEHRRKPLSLKTMELLGATVGRVASVVKQKEKK